MAHLIGQTERLVAINKLLPELENFLRETLGKEQLSEAANAKREEFLTKVENLNKPPQLPPPRNAKKLSVPAPTEDPGQRHPALITSRDFISRQRELSWIQKDTERPPQPRPYQSRKRQVSDEIERESLPSTSEESNILYDKIRSESGSEKYVDIGNIEGNAKPPIPQRSQRIQPPQTQTADRESLSHPWKDNLNEIRLHNLENQSRSGPLTNLRTQAKLWVVLKSKRLFIFRDITQPCSQVIDMSEYDVHVDNSSNANFRLSKPGSPSLLLAAENSEDHTQWIHALERCKYEDIDELMSSKSAKNRSSFEKELIDDPDYEVPQNVVEKIRQNVPEDNSKTPNDFYVDMHGGPARNGSDYIDPTKQRSPFYESLADLKYDPELPPIPLSSDEEVLGDYGKDLKAHNGHPNDHSSFHHSDENISGSFESLSSSSDDEAPPLPERKPRSSSGPPGYNVNNFSVNSLDRKKSNSLGRKLEKDAFFNDSSALHVGILHQRRVLAVWQKRYCKIKNETLYAYRNPDNEEKPAVEISLPEVDISLCDKETWRSHSFKIALPRAETVYFAAETREMLMTWLKILVQETDKFKLAGKDVPGRENSKSHLAPNDTIDSASTSSVERKEAKDGSADSGSESTASADSEASDRDLPDHDRKKALKKRSSFQKSPSQKKRSDREVDIDGKLYLEKSGKWLRFWCKVQAKKFEAYNSKSSKSPENSVVLSESNLVTLPKTIMEEINYYVIKLTWSDDSVVLLAKDEFEWKKWMALLKKFIKGRSENAELHHGLPDLPFPKRKGERKPRSKSKSAYKNGHLAPVNASDVPQDRKQLSLALTRLKDSTDATGNDVFCEVRDGFIVIAHDTSLERKIIESPVRKIKLGQKELARDDFHVFEVRTSDSALVLAVKEERDFLQLIEVLWLQNAQIDSEKGTPVWDCVSQLKKRYKRRSIAFDSELIDLETGDKSSLPKHHGFPVLVEPLERTASDGEQFGPGRKPPRPNTKADLKRSPLKQSGTGKGSRMSTFFRSLPRRRHKKYDFASGDVVDGMPKIQFNGTVTEVKTDNDGVETMHERHCKISGKIFYAYEPGSDVKPVFKVPLRNATIEEMVDKQTSKFLFNLSSMEDRRSFRFVVDTEEEFDNWSNALYMVDSKSNPGRMSSRESLLDETKSDADTDAKLETPTGAFSGSNSNSSISSLLSKQAKSLAGSCDESKVETPPTRKISEDVFTGGVENVRHSGFLYEMKISESNGIKSRTKIRRWCVLRQSWIEIYNGKNDKVPNRGIAIGHHTVDAVSVEESGEKWAMSLKSDNESFILCANNEEDFLKWQHEFKKVTKKFNRKPSDTAKLKLKSAGEGLRQLLSSSSLSGISKRDSKRNTIVLNANDEKVVDSFAKDIESGNKISGILSIISMNDKPTRPKKRFCSIHDGKFCIAKRSKPQKFIQTIDLSSIAILDECDMEKGIFRFRLDFGKDESLVFQTVDHPTAENWMVAISMAILLERLTSPDKFPQQGDQGGEKGERGEEEQFSPPETDELGLVDLSPVLGREDRGSQSSAVVREAGGSESSNLSNDIRMAIDRKISGGSSYLNPLSNLLESAFTPGPYSESSTPSSREGTLERNMKGKEGQRMNSGEAIMEEEREDSEGIVCSSPKTERKQSILEEAVPTRSSVSKTVARYEKMLPRSKESFDDSVFHNETEQSEIEAKLAELSKAQGDLEKERSVILNRLPVLKNEVDAAKIRKERGSSTSEGYNYEEEHETLNNDFKMMQTRLAEIEKRLQTVRVALQNRRSSLKEPFRQRSIVISPHVIV